MTLLWRLAVMFVGYLASAAVIVPLGIVIFALAHGDHPTVAAMLVGYALAAFVLLLVLTFAPVFLIIAIAEWKRIRDWRYFTLAGGLTALLLLAALGILPISGGGNPVLSIVSLVGGLAGGFVYWVIAGRTSGALREAWSAGKIMR